MDKPARGVQPGTSRESKERDRESKPAPRPTNGTIPGGHVRSPPVHLKSDVDAKTRAGIVKNGPVINVRTVQAKVAAAAAAAKTNQSAPGVKPPAAGNSTTNAWANGPLPAVRKSVAAQRAATSAQVTSASGGSAESGSAGSEGWFSSAWATPWAKVAAAGTGAAGQGSSAAVSRPRNAQDLELLCIWSSCCCYIGSKMRAALLVGKWLERLVRCPSCNGLPNLLRNRPLVQRHTLSSF